MEKPAALLLLLEVSSVKTPTKAAEEMRKSGNVKRKEQKCEVSLDGIRNVT